MNKEINLKETFKTIKKRLWILVLLTTVFTAMGILYTMKPETPLYEAAARVIVRADYETMYTLRAMIREPAVLDKVIEALALHRSSNALRGQIRVDNVESSQILIITVTDEDSGAAIKIANMTAKIYKEQMGPLMNFTNISILSEAKTAYLIPQGGNAALVMSIIVGLVIGIGIIFLLDSLDDTIKSERDVETWLELPVLGCVAKINKKDAAAAARKKKQGINPSVRGETVGS